MHLNDNGDLVMAPIEVTRLVHQLEKIAYQPRDPGPRIPQWVANNGATPGHYSRKEFAFPTVRELYIALGGDDPYVTDGTVGI